MQQENQNIEHLLGIFASLLRLLPGGSAARIRTLAKFMEKEYEKIDKLVKLRRDYASRVTPVEQAIEKERKNFDKEEQEIMAPEWLSRRFDAGLFSIQLIDVILAWLVAEDDGAKQKVVTLLKDRDEDLSLIRGTLQGELRFVHLIPTIPNANCSQSKSRDCQRMSLGKRTIKKCLIRFCSSFGNYRRDTYKSCIVQPHKPHNLYLKM